MPQMSPMLWFNLYLYFLILIFIIMLMIYNLLIFNNLIYNFNKIYKINFKFLW